MIKIKILHLYIVLWANFDTSRLLILGYQLYGKLKQKNKCLSFFKFEKWLILHLFKLPIKFFDKDIILQKILIKENLMLKIMGVYMYIYYMYYIIKYALHLSETKVHCTCTGTCICIHCIQGYFYPM